LLFHAIILYNYTKGVIMAFSWITSILKSVGDVIGLSSGEIMEWDGSNFTNVDNFTLADHNATDHEPLLSVLSPTEHLAVDHGPIASVLSPAEHAATDHTSLTGVNPTGQLKASVTVTSAQILALFTTPITLIAAPAAGNYIVVESISALNDFGTAAYVVNAGGMAIKYSGGSTVFTLDQSWGQAASDQLNTFGGSSLASVPAATALTISANVANPTTGDGEWDIEVVYRIVTA
jgi:hypothetical protein